MNKLIISLLFIAQALNALAQTIYYSNSSSSSGCAQNNTLSFIYSFGNPVRNAYKGTLANGFSQAQVRWDGVDKWIIEHDHDGIGPSAPVTYYSNTFASYPNPPDLNTGTWVTVNGTCGSITLFAGPGTQSVLPTELTVSVHGAGSHLSWRTASETQNAHFLVQHSTDGRSFQDLAKIPGTGNSQVENSYEYLHKSPSNGTNYYRLKQVDFDGRFEFSQVVSVEMTGGSPRLTIFPNPSDGNFSLFLQDADALPKTALLVDLWGRIVWEFSIDDEAQEIPCRTSLPTGIYFLCVESGNEVWREQVVVH